MTKDIVRFELIESNVAQYIKSKRYLHRYRCFCGKDFIANKHEIVRGNKTSCGCLTRAINSEKHTIHGMSRTRLFSVWRSMKKRCLLLSHDAYYRYGGEGIMICEEWLNFENFAMWALSSGYAENLTIDRIENDQGYNAKNCKWSTHTEQNQNKKNNVVNSNMARLIIRLVRGGLSHAEVARIFDISRPTVSYILRGKTWANCTTDMFK